MKIHFYIGLIVTRILSADIEDIDCKKTESNYPSNITVSSTSIKVKDPYGIVLGLYRKVPNLEIRGKPVWKHVLIDWYLFNDDYKVWRLGQDYRQNNGIIHSTPIGELSFIRTQWFYLSGSNGLYEWLQDDSISVVGSHPSYPNLITVTGVKGNQFSGNYTRANDDFNMMPYFLQGDNFLFFDENQWYIGEALGNSKTKLKKVYGWSYSDSNTIWPNISTLYIADYPDSVNVSSAGGAQELYPDLMGIYQRVSSLLYWGRPVWKHSLKEVFLHFIDVWSISYIVGDLQSIVFETKYGSYDELISIPRTGWIYKNGTATAHDTTMVVAPP